MSDLDLQTIRRYLEEMGFPDLPDEQVMALQKDVMARLKQEPEKPQQNKFTNDYYEESEDEQIYKKSSNDTPSPPKLQQGKDINETSEDEEISDDTKFARMYSENPHQNQSRNTQRQHPQQSIESDDSDQYVPVFKKQTRKPVDKKPIRMAKEDLLRQQLLESSSSDEESHYQPKQSYQSTYQSTLRTTGHTRINGLLGPNQYTLSEKKKRKADPVSNFHKYQARWSIQGAPQERAQRNWSNKQKGVQKTSTITTTGRYYE
ncbi:hypothetical protein SS50377_26128 [Spironucleus salmonicida]|uniref:Centriolar and ciliogenesis-associated protein HYLS1 C-terminal domain-containing protein n=1 Tax=Spironucleus salmonicida TaxID=348837 RepID=V6LZR0_9EUKA|nr:hypothetical protein SS50377_26128 [Spironucleus salmonicida]|eukprot:EST46334.1 hypothetical protein SS50377_13645 [Spironucleus salmonicida]